MARPHTKAAAPPAPAAEAEGGFFDLDPEASARLGERLRRVALGLTGALVVSRAYWPSEFAREADTGRGLPWVLALLLALGLTIAGLWIGGRTRPRLSWADTAVV